MRARSKMEAVFVRIMSLVSSGRSLIAVSTSAMMFLYGIFAGVMANFGPFSRRDHSASVRGFFDRFITDVFLVAFVSLLYSSFKLQYFFVCLVLMVSRTDCARCFKNSFKFLNVFTGKIDVSSILV